MVGQLNIFIYQLCTLDSLLAKCWFRREWDTKKLHCEIVVDMLVFSSYIFIKVYPSTKYILNLIYIY